MRKEIYEKVKALRKKNGYSQKEVAKNLHVNQNTYSLIESGKTKIDVEAHSNSRFL